MKKSHYKKIAELKKFVEHIRNSIASHKAAENLHELFEEIEGDYDDRSETWQESENGCAERTRVSDVEDIVNDVENLRETLRNIINRIEEIENDAPEGIFD
jgi:uncharacterized protein Yka (UPF0111/DUF47 family)